VLPKPPSPPPGRSTAWRTADDLSFTTHGYTRDALRSPSAGVSVHGDTAEVTAVAYQRIHERMLAKADEHKGGRGALRIYPTVPGPDVQHQRAIIH